MTKIGFYLFFHKAITKAEHHMLLSDAHTTCKYGKLNMPYRVAVVWVYNATDAKISKL